MDNNKDRITASFAMGIQKSPSDVFDAITDGKKMAEYFTHNTTEIMEEGKTVTWSFPEFPDSFPVLVKRIIPSKLIEFEWDPKSLVTVRLNMYNDDTTVVSISETGYSMDKEGIDWAVRQAGGWGGFLSALKAYLEYGINLRKGAYEFMADENYNDQQKVMDN